MSHTNILYEHQTNIGSNIIYLYKIQKQRKKGIKLVPKLLPEKSVFSLTRIHLFDVHQFLFFSIKVKLPQ